MFSRLPVKIVDKTRMKNNATHPAPITPKVSYAEPAFFNADQRYNYTGSGDIPGMVKK